MHDPYLWMEYFTGWKTVGHISSQILRCVYFFIKQERDRVYGKLKSLKYKTSPIPSGGLEVPLKFESQDKWVTDAMEKFVENLYSFDFTGNLVVNDEDEEEVDFETIEYKIQMRMMKVRLMRKIKKTVTLDDPITNETKEAPVVIID